MKAGALIAAFQDSFKKLANKYGKLRVCSVVTVSDTETGANFVVQGSPETAGYVEFCIKSVNLPNPVARWVLQSIIQQYGENPDTIQKLRTFIEDAEKSALADCPIEEKDDWQRLFPQMKRAIDQIEEGKFFQVPPVVALTLFNFVQMASSDVPQEPEEDIFSKLKKKR